MLIAALLVGLLTAYYFGLRPGMIAAGVTAALFLLAMVAPPLAPWAYVAVGLGVAGVLTAGRHLRRKGSPAQVAILARAGLAQLRRAVRQVTGGGGAGDRRGGKRAGR
ncbi:MAG TPA: hypothetical protein VKZ63_18390 [Kofleriaceae bacterium]|nr:hypothetical protein [Kofleriaceae bacterium]